MNEDWGDLPQALCREIVGWPIFFDNRCTAIVDGGPNDWMADAFTPFLTEDLTAQEYSAIGQPCCQETAGNQPCLPPIVHGPAGVHLSPKPMGSEAPTGCNGGIYWPNNILTSISDPVPVYKKPNVNSAYDYMIPPSAIPYEDLSVYWEGTDPQSNQKNGIQITPQTC